MKTLIKRTMIFALFVIVGWVLYVSIGHLIIKAMYEGKAFPFLNRIIQGRDVHSLS